MEPKRDCWSAAEAGTRVAQSCAFDQLDSHTSHCLIMTGIWLGTSKAFVVLTCSESVTDSDGVSPRELFGSALPRHATFSQAC